MTDNVALHGRAIFGEHDHVMDLEAVTEEQRGPWPAWVLFTWKINEMVPEVFATKNPKRNIKLLEDSPAVGWTTEEYKRARVIHPPHGSGNSVIVQATDPRLYNIWDKAMQILISYGIHQG